MNCWSDSFWFDAWVRSACASTVRADSSIALRSLTRPDSSSRSSVPITCPAFTRLPSATYSACNVPLARAAAVCGATSGPEKEIVTGSDAIVGCTISRCVNSSVTSGLPLGLSALRPIATPAINATATTAANPPMTQRLPIVGSFLPLS